MLIRLLAMLFFAVAIAVVLVRQPVKRANAWGGVLGGAVLIAAGAAHAWPRSNVRLVDVLLLRLDPRDFHEYDATFCLLLGYGLALGALAAMPWLAHSTAGEFGTLLRESVSSQGSWRKPLVRRVRWLLVLTAILLLWRVIGASYR